MAINFPMGFRRSLSRHLKAVLNLTVFSPHPFLADLSVTHFSDRSDRSIDGTACFRTVGIVDDLLTLLP